MKNQPAARPAHMTGHWTKVKNNPPTYYPKGVPADHPTNHDDGYWVTTGDARETRYFIPLHADLAIPQSVLIAEAMAACDPSKEIKQFARDRANRNARKDPDPRSGWKKTSDALSIIPPVLVCLPWVILAGATPMHVSERDE